MTAIKDSYHQGMSIEEAEKLILQTLKNVMEEKITKDNVEIAIVRTSTRKQERRSVEHIESVIS